MANFVIARNDVVDCRPIGGQRDPQGSYRSCTAEHIEEQDDGPDLLYLTVYRYIGNDCRDVTGGNSGAIKWSNNVALTHYNNIRKWVRDHPDQFMERSDHDPDAVQLRQQQEQQEQQEQQQAAAQAQLAQQTAVQQAVEHAQQQAAAQAQLAQQTAVQQAVEHAQQQAAAQAQLAQQTAVQQAVEHAQQQADEQRGQMAQEHEAALREKQSVIDLLQKQLTDKGAETRQLSQQVGKQEAELNAKDQEVEDLRGLVADLELQLQARPTRNGGHQVGEDDDEEEEDDDIHFGLDEDDGAGYADNGGAGGGIPADGSGGGGGGGGGGGDAFPAEQQQQQQQRGRRGRGGASTAHEGENENEGDGVEVGVQADGGEFLTLEKATALFEDSIALKLAQLHRDIRAEGDKDWNKIMQCLKMLQDQISTSNAKMTAVDDLSKLAMEKADIALQGGALDALGHGATAPASKSGGSDNDSDGEEEDAVGRNDEMVGHQPRMVDAGVDAAGNNFVCREEYDADRRKDLASHRKLYGWLCSELEELKSKMDSVDAKVDRDELWKLRSNMNFLEELMEVVQKQQDDMDIDIETSLEALQELREKIKVLEKQRKAEPKLAELEENFENLG